MRDAAAERTRVDDPDADLLGRFASGDRAAARALTDRLLPPALAQARRMLGDGAEAEDVAQEAMLRLWRGADTWRTGEARVSTWLYRVVRNLCIDRQRKRRPAVPVDEEMPLADPALDVLSGMMHAERSRAVVTAMRALPERQRQALILRHFEDCSNPEIAAALDCSVEAVESLLARARRALAEMIDQKTKVS